MAILIGVIALAVIPNIQRSRESKDLQQLDSLASATNVALANKATASKGSYTIDFSKKTLTKDKDGIADAVQNDIGDLTKIALAAGCVSDAKATQIVVSWEVDSTNGTTVVKVTTNNTVTCNYTTKEDGTTKQTYLVETGKAASN